MSHTNEVLGATRIVEVLAQGRSRCSTGSGYLITERHVLTAAHNVATAESEIYIRALDGVQRPVRVLTAGAPEGRTDLAVLEIPEPGTRLRAPDFLAVDRTYAGVVAECVAMGFPSFKWWHWSGRRNTDTVQVNGTIHLVSGLKRGVLELRVDHRPATGKVGSAWAGMSGAAVFAPCGTGYGLVGIITEHALAEGDSSLSVVPITNLREALGNRTTEICTAWNVDLDRLPSVPERTDGRMPPRAHTVNLKRRAESFTGRQAELDQIRAAIAEPTGPIVVLHGMGGVGKTALAREIAHELDDRPRVVIELSLDDTDAEAAARREYRIVFDALDGPDAKIPAGLRGQQNHYQDLLERGPSLVIIDNATTAEQVEWFLPRHAAAGTIVTSRFPLTEFRACRVPVAPLSAGDALTYLRNSLGAERIDTYLHAAHRLAALTGGLPLALTLIAGLATKPRWLHQPLSEVAGLLADETGRLEHLGGPARGKDYSVRASFDLSYQHLRPPTATFCRQLSQLVGPDFGVERAAATAAVPIDEAADAVDELTEAHLLTVTDSGRLRMHDLVRVYAREQAERAETEEDRETAFLRSARWFIDRIEEWQPQIVAGEVPTPEALAWFVAEDRALQATLAVADEKGHWELVLHLARGLRTSLFYRGRYADLVHVARRGLAAADRAGLEAKAVGLMIHLAQAQRAINDPDGVAELYDRAESLTPDEDKAAWIRVHRGDFLLEQGRPDEALAVYRDARAVYDRRQDPAARIWLAGHELDALRAVDRYDEAVEVGEEVLAMSLEREIPGEIAWCRGHLGLLYLKVGRYAEATGLLTLALRYAEDERDLVGQAHRHRQVAWVAIADRQMEAARDHLESARELAERVGVAPLIEELTEELDRLG